MIVTTYSPTSYNGDGVTVAFPITWGINASSEIVVTETIIATGVETVKTLTTHYTVTGTGPLTVTAVTAPAATVRWTISRNVPSTQLVDYVENDSFPAATHEGALDKLTMLSQEHDAAFLRTLHQPDGDSATITSLPPVIDRASMYLGFDDDGNPTALDAPTDTSLTTAFTQTLLDDADLVTFFETLGADVQAWTPSLGGNATYTSRVGSSIKLGRLVFIQCRMVVNVIGTGSTNQITGVPYGAADFSEGPVFISSASQNIVAIVASLAGTTISLHSLTAAGATMGSNAVLGNGTTVKLSMAFISD